MLLRVGPPHQLPAKPVVARPRGLVSFRHVAHIRAPIAAPVRAVAEPPAAVSDAALDAAAESSEPGNGEEATAIRRFMRGSPSKVRRVLNVIRGMTYEQALKALTYLPYRYAQPHCVRTLCICIERDF
jgi:hypothetical protein